MSAMARSLLVIAAVASLARAMKHEAFALPNGDWAGVDGNWSTVQFNIGSDAQPVHVLVGTALSEFWAVGPGGCYPSASNNRTSRCVSADNLQTNRTALMREGGFIIPMIQMTGMI